jgi:hypothetical protein
MRESWAEWCLSFSYFLTFLKNNLYATFGLLTSNETNFNWARGMKLGPDGRITVLRTDGRKGGLTRCAEAGFSAGYHRGRGLRLFFWYPRGHFISGARAGARARVGS